MSRRRKPSNPSAIKKEHVTAALANVSPVRVKKVPTPERPDKTILQAGAEIVEALDRVMKRRVTYVQQRLMPAKPKQTPSGNETRERAAHARDGVEKESLSKNDGHQRARIRSPMALVDETMHRDRQALVAAKGRKEAAEPPLRQSRFDKALDHEDGPILRAVLSRYVVDEIMAQTKSGPSMGETVNCASAPHDRLALTPTQQAALSRLSFVKKHLSAKDMQDLRDFMKMMAPVSQHDDPGSMADYGRQKSGLADDRVREGVFIGVMIKIAERLHDVYRLRELAPKIERLMKNGS